MNWTANHTRYLEDLRSRWSRYEANGNPNRPAQYKGAGFGYVYGNAGRIKSERQFVLDRFRTRYDINRHETSDQSIWAKYRRVNGLAGKAKAAMARFNVAKIFRSSNGMVFTDGMKMKNWKDLGLNHLGEGATRVVYELDDQFVLKVAKDPNKAWAGFDGTKSNTRERKVWEKAANTPDAEHFAAIAASDSEGQWIIQERVPKAGHDSRLTDAERRSLVRAATKYNVSDLHGGNFGRRANGKAVVIDYASA